jgi:signal transduction histidine kinase
MNFHQKHLLEKEKRLKTGRVTQTFKVAYTAVIDQSSSDYRPRGIIQIDDAAKNFSITIGSMSRTLLLFSLVCQVIATAMSADPLRGKPYSSPQLAQLSLAQLERRLLTIDDGLKTLARFNMQSGIGPVGFRSRSYPDAAHTEWIRIEWGHEVSFDQVVLVPAIGRSSLLGLHAQCFPSEFQIVVGSETGTEGHVIARYQQADQLLPRIAPVIVNCPGTTASWLQVQASALSRLEFDKKFCLELAEILVFHGQENVALHNTVKSSSEHKSGAWQSRFLVDGFVPYVLDTQVGEQSVAMVTAINLANASLTIDLGMPQPLNRIHLHSVDMSDNIPQAVPTDFGIPQKFVIQGSNRDDFTDAVQLVEYQRRSLFDVGPIMMRNFPETTCRFVRLMVLEPDRAGDNKNFGASRLGFAEIEIFSAGANVAFGMPVSANFTPSIPTRPLALLTDGRNFYGNVLPVRNWLNQLAHRHDLETERPQVIAEIGLRYSRQKLMLTTMVWLVVLLAVAIGFSILIQRILLIRQAEAIRERLTADMHDELGGNLHAIGLIGDHAQALIDSPEKLKPLMQRLRELTDRTSDAARYCTRTLSTRYLHNNLTEEMQRTSARIMANLEHDFAFEGEEHLCLLSSGQRDDLLLFYKECLVNISRHSEATKFTTQLIANQSEVQLWIRDNGRGFSMGDIAIPPSLQRRARLLGAQVKMEKPSGDGTCVHLKLALKRWRICRQGK